MNQPLFESNIPYLKLLTRGKVRDIYDVGTELLLVATDRLSAFDVVFPNPIPEKGEILTQLSLFWFDKIKSIIPNHLSEKPVRDLFKNDEDRRFYEKRSLRVKKARPLVIEAVVRGYLAGSGWNDYKKTGAVCGVRLPSGLKESQKLPEPIFTPATKAPQGEHDENISFEKACALIGQDLAEQVQHVSLQIYQEGCNLAESRGLILADTKFEFGLYDGELILIDEVLTPDSSRFWPKDSYQVGISPPSFDKQFVRDYLLRVGWNKKPPAPELPSDVVRQTSVRYKEALARLAGAAKK